jgi:F420-dependent oxidoreductase-like protein
VKLGVNLICRGAAELAVRAEELGYHVAFAPEGNGSDAVSVLGLVAGRTSRIGLGSAVMQIPARSPASTALTASTLQTLSGGRFRLGLGVSNPDVSDGWHGVPFARPTARTREYLEIVRMALAGEPLRYEGEHYRLPASGDERAPVPLVAAAPEVPVPIHLAAMGPGNMRLAGAVADGWIGVFMQVQDVADAVSLLAEGRRRAGVDMTGFEVTPCLATAIGADVEECVDLLRPHFAHLMGIGAAERNVYCRLAARLGYPDEAAEVNRRVHEGDRAGAATAVPTGFVDRTALVGPVERVGERMRAYAGAGATTLSVMVSAAATDLDGRMALLSEAMAALDASGVRT